MISNATAVEALPDMGRININGSNSEGILNILSIGERIDCIKSKIPDVLRLLTAKNRATNVGNIFITVDMPLFAPN